jgi:hypothetical protein
MKTCFEEIRDKEGNDNMKGYSYSSAYEAPLGSLGMNKGTSVTPPTLTEEQSTIGHSLEQIKKRPYLKIFQLRNAARSLLSSLPNSKMLQDESKSSLRLLNARIAIVS